MSATVFRTGHGRAQAYCSECGDGINASPAKALAWATEHNAEKHPAST